MKATLIGDGDVGKTSLLSVYKWNIFPTEYVPTVLDFKLLLNLKTEHLYTVWIDF